MIKREIQKKAFLLLFHREHGPIILRRERYVFTPLNMYFSLRVRVFCSPDEPVEYKWA